MSPTGVTYQDTGRTESAWWRRIGILGFTFFFLKGLAWLIAPLALYVIR